MDEPCSRDVLRACLRDLARVNRWFLGYRPVLDFLEGTSWPARNGPLRILDVGCGYGDGLRRIERWARERGVAVELTGLDLNPDTIAIAAEAAPTDSRIRWVQANVFDYKMPGPAHLIVSSLFTHHLRDEDVVRFVKWMEENAELGWFVNDLSRAPIPYHLFRWFSKAAGLHPFVQHDGPVSFLRAFVADDWRTALRRGRTGQQRVRDTQLQACTAVREPQEIPMSHSRPMRENLVIGGGLAGAMAALRLAAAGRDVLLVEKERGAHHKVCGEFLSPEAVEYLRQAGVDPVRLGAAVVDRLRVSAKRRVVESRLPFRALSLSRCVLDAALLARAADAGCEVRRGVHVQGLARDGQGWMAQLSDGEAQSARNVFLATGKHDLHGWNRPQGRQGDLVGFKMHWRLRTAQTAELRGFMDLFLFEGGYGGLALVEEDTANLCLVVRRSRLREARAMARTAGELVRRERDDCGTALGAQPLWERPLAISSIPYGYLCEREDGVWPVGDQAAVIPSFTGDGMAIALHSGALAAEMYLSGESPEKYLSKVARRSCVEACRWRRFSRGRW